jgi:hypothetical protein
MVQSPWLKKIFKNILITGKKRRGVKSLPSRVSTRQIPIRLAVGIAILLAAFFGSAGTLAWPEAWLYLIIRWRGYA